MRVTAAALAILAVTMVGSQTACSSGDSVLVEQHEITTGSFRGLRIGMTKEEAATVAKSLGAHTISAAPCRQFKVTGANTQELPSLGSLEGIRATNAQGAFEDVYFVNGQVSKTVGTPGTNLLSGINIGDQLKLVGERLQAALRSEQGLAIQPIVDIDNRGVLELNSDAVVDMSGHDCWQFETNAVAPAGAVYQLQFAANGLQRVLYRRPRVRAE